MINRILKWYYDLVDKVDNLFLELALTNSRLDNVNRYAKKIDKRLKDLENVKGKSVAKTKK